jgi:hypothetical protein
VDETGCTATGKLILSDRAWTQLLGGPVSELALADTDLLKYMEQRLLFHRVTLLFGWASEQGENGMGRLYIWEISV